MCWRWTAPALLPDWRAGGVQVEPVQWAPHRLRRVLNAAISGPITADDLADAAAAVAGGFTGSLPLAAEAAQAAAVAPPAPRRESSAAEAAAAVAAEHSPQRHPELAAAAAHGAAHAPAEPPALPAGEGGEHGEDAVTAELASAQRQVEQDLLQMVLRLDLDWDAPGAG